MSPSDAIGLSGLIDTDVAALFAESLAELPPTEAKVVIDLSRARVTDPAIADIVAEAIRQTALRLGALEVKGAPTAIRERLGSSPGLVARRDR